MREIAQKVDRNRAYPIEDAVALLSDLSRTSFAESIDVCWAVQ